jgi:uncharacterized protein YkwD
MGGFGRISFPDSILYFFKETAMDFVAVPLEGLGSPKTPAGFGRMRLSFLPHRVGRTKNYLLLSSVALALAGCGGSDTASDGAALQSAVAQQDALGDAPQAPTSLEGMGHTLRSESAQSLLSKQSVGGYTIDTRHREAVRLMYQSVFAASNGVPPAWVGDVAACNAGDTSAESKEATLRRINWFRAMAGTPADVQFDATFNQKAQQAALMMAANNALSHFPPTTWKCYTAVGAEAAGKANISLGRKSGVDTITDGYMRDPGSNNAAVGHRRWLLYPQTRFMGTGDVNSATARSNALWVMDGNYSSPRPKVRDEFVSWPPPGFVPYTTVYPRWSFSYPRADFSAATVTMTQDGVALATRKEALKNGAGENTLVWFPGSYADGNNWARPARDTLYRVTVQNVKIDGLPRTFTYDVNVFDPDVETSKVQLRGSDALAVGQAGTYTFDAIASADAYQWRSVVATPYALSDSAEAGTGNFDVTISSGYDVNPTGVAATGSRSFRLQHSTTVDQILKLKTVLVPNGSSQLLFKSRLGYATPGQRAMVEASIDDGKIWVPLYEQSGTDSPEPAFSSKTVSLAAFAGRTTMLRLRFAHTGGSYYSQGSSLIGWFVDDVVLSGTDATSIVGVANDVNTGAVTPAPAAAPLFADGAESGVGNFLLTTSAGYNVVEAGAKASGSYAFHLAHPQPPVNQFMQIKPVLTPSASTVLQFASRLGFATTGQVAVVEVSINNGASWVEVFRQAGKGSAETSFSNKSVSLAAYAGQNVLVRFKYAFNGGSYYPQITSNVGWLIDDIRVGDTVTTTTPTAPTGPFSFSFASNTVGTVWLQARPGMYGHYAGWGPLKSVRVGN